MDAISTENFIKKYTSVNFLSMAQSESSPRVRERLLGIHQLFQGKNRIESAAAVGRNPEWLRSWVLRYHNKGYEGLFDKSRSGQPSYLTYEQELELQTDILEIQELRNGGRVTARDVQEHIKKKFKVEYKYKSVFDVLERLGLSWVSSRSKHPLSDETKQNNFKKIFKARVAKISTTKKKNRSLVPR